MKQGSNVNLVRRIQAVTIEVAIIIDVVVALITMEAGTSNPEYGTYNNFNFLR